MRHLEEKDLLAIETDAKRPGMPMERQPPAPLPFARPLAPTRGSSAPLHGVSGLVRRRAYRVPDHQAAHWLLLRLGDRIDVVESWLRERRAWVLGAAALAAVGLAVKATR